MTISSSAVRTGSSAVAQAACLAALAELAAAHDVAGAHVAELGEALAAAWWTGVRDLEVLARAAGCTAGHARERLAAHGVDASRAALNGPPGPRFAPLRAEDVHQLAQVADAVCGPAVLVEQPGPAAEALWQLSIGLERLATAIDPASESGHAAEMADDLIFRLREALAHAQALVAGRYSREELAAKARQEDVDLFGDGGQAVADGATVTLSVPAAYSITVKVAPAPDGRPDAGHLTLGGAFPLLNTAVTGAEHLQLRAALDTIAQVVSRHLHPEAFEEG
ncbi:hypothetical protein [Kitasatospora sp. NPDC059327]|uniref:hypothetical protein n=1 Tax=Kitasatospora sp. NPDC059327 TaxID=3346803 RepID=UPI0036915CC5